MTKERTRRHVLASTTGLAAAALAGCLGSANSGSTDTPDTDTPTHHDHGGHSHGEITGPHDSAEVRMITTDAGTHFDPHVVWVKPGSTVTWINESGSHTTTAYAPANDKPQRIPDDAAAWDSGTMTEEGATFEHTFETPGVYDYLCLPHETTGMLGTVIVGEPDPHDQPGLAEPQDSLPDKTSEKVHSLNEKVNEALGHQHDEGTSTSDGDDDGHHDDGTSTDDGHHDDDDGHHDDETSTEDGHHDETETADHDDDH